jgi:hypothetical protein
MSNDKQRSRRILSSFCSGTVEIILPFLFLRRQRRWIHYEAAACKIGSHFALQLSIICSLQINSQYERNFKWSYRHKTLQTITLFSEANHTGPWNHRLEHSDLLYNRNVWSHEQDNRMSKERYQNSTQSEINSAGRPSVNATLAIPFLSVQYNNRWVKEKGLSKSVLTT